MLKRREFIKQSVTVAALAATGILAAPAGALTLPYKCAAPVTVQPAVDLVLVDERYSDSRTFAAALKDSGADSFSVAADLGRLWYGPLGKRFEQRGIRMAGMTSHSEFHLAQGLAAERGGRLIYMGRHDCRRTRVLNHSFYLSSSSPALSGGLQVAGSEWPRKLAQMLVAVDHPAGTLTEQFSLVTARADDHPGTLWSWLIA